MKMTDLTIQPFDPSTVSNCENCGRFHALEIAGKFLCVDCINLAGSSCAGGGDDAGG
jgi:hypothetical protein